jgi:hypothetical protein
VKLTARETKEFSFATRTNVKLARDNRSLELTSKNQFPNSRFARAEANGDLEFYGPIKLRTRKRGRNVYIRPKGGVAMRQNAYLIPLYRTGYLQDEPLVEGEELPGQYALSNVLRAAQPRVTAVGDSERGYEVGNYRNGYCWVLGDPTRGDKRILSLPSPTSAQFALTSQQTYRQLLPQSVPHEGITGIAMLQTPPGGTYPTQAYVQNIIDIRDFLPDSIRMIGPLIRKTLAPTTNETYIGALGRYDKLQRRFINSPVDRAFTLKDAELAWQFRTDVGWSAMQDSEVLAFVDDRDDTAMRIRPERLPRLATHWRPLILLSDGLWYTWTDEEYGFSDGALPVGTAALLYTDNPDDWHDSSDLVEAIYQVEDLTGILAPEEPLEAPDLTAVVRLGAGTYDAYTTDVYSTGEESRPSFKETAVLTTNQNLLVNFRDPKRKTDSGTIPNADLSERLANGLPRYWTRDIAAPVVVPGDLGWEIRDTSNSASARIYATQVNIDVLAATPYALRFYVDILRYVNGAAGVRIQPLNSSFGAIGSPVDFTTTADGWVEKLLAPSGVTGVDFNWPSGTEYFTLRVIATPTASVVNLDFDIKSLDMFPGYTTPRKRLDETTVSAGADELFEPIPVAENHTYDYPEGAYAVLVTDYVSAGINAIEYYASYDAELTERVLIEDFEVTVDPSTQYTLQVSVEAAGIPLVGTRLFRGVWLDEEGRIVGRTAGIPIVPGGTTGITSGVKSMVMTSPATARSWKCTSNTLGRGRLAVYKPQLEVGGSATAWSSDYNSPGTVTQIFETLCPGAPYLSRNGMLSAVKRVFAIVALANLPTNTNATVRVAFKYKLNDAAYVWGPWFTDPEDITLIDVLPYAKVEVTLTSSDLLDTPQLYEYGIKLERDVAVLLRWDGSEYYGGIHVQNMPAINYPSNEEVRRNRFGQSSFVELFTAARTRNLNGLELVAYNRRGVERAHRDAARGKRQFQIEHRGRLYVATILDLNFELDGKELPNGFGVWTARNVDAVLQEERDL